MFTAVWLAMLVDMLLAQDGGGGGEGAATTTTAGAGGDTTTANSSTVDLYAHTTKQGLLLVPILFVRMLLFGNTDAAF